jgi:TolA-binding protein
VKTDTPKDLDTEFIRKKIAESLEDKRRKSFNFRTLTIGVSVMLSFIGLVIFVANARPILADIFTTPDVINRHTREIKDLSMNVAELQELRREFHNLNGQVNQLRAVMDGQLSLGRKLEDSIMQLQYMTSENQKVNQIHLDGLRDAIREVRKTPRP